jgi:hypothetical protein
LPLAGCHDSVELIELPTIDPTSNVHVHGANVAGPGAPTARYALASRPVDVKQLVCGSPTPRPRT